MENKETFSEIPYFAVPYYDDIFKNVSRKSSIFSSRGIYKKYTSKMTIVEKNFKDGEKTKKYTIYIDLGVNKFIMANTIYGVLNLRSYRDCILKHVPQLPILLIKNRIELNKKVTKGIVKVNQLIIGENLNDGTFQRIGTPYMTFTTIEQLLKGYEQYMRDYYLNKRYDLKIHTVKIEIFYTHV